MARPSKYTPATAQKITTALSAGNTRKASCAYAGIGQTTFAEWLERFRDFREAVEKAEADAEVRHVANIAKAAGEGTWTASAWWLERRRHKDWGKLDRVEHSGPDGGALVFTLDIGRKGGDDANRDG